QRSDPRPGLAAPVRIPLPRYRRPLAQRPGGVPFRGAPAARGIGSLGRGKEGRSKRVLLVSNAVGLRVVHGAPLLRPIPAGSANVLLRPHGQADDCYVALRASVVGFLAVATLVIPGAGRSRRQG